MPKKTRTLTALEVKHLKHRTNPDGKPATAFHAVGEVPGLLLQCSPPSPGSGEPGRSWVLRIMIGGKRRSIGLGSYPAVTLSQARINAREMLDMRAKGIDPLAEKRRQQSALAAEAADAIILKDIIDEYIKKKSSESKNPHRQGQKLTTYLNYCKPLHRMRPADIKLKHVEQIIRPIWSEKTETANRVRLHLERALDLAGIRGLREGENPARWRGNLDQIFEKPSKISKTQHRAALAVDLLPDFFNRLQQEKGISNIALSMIILTASRLKEITEAKWNEYDPDSAVLTIPNTRTKTGKQHRIPLPPAAVALIEQMKAWFPPATPDTYIFSASGKPLSDVAIAKVHKKLHPGITTHGFRSTFKDWCRIHAPEFNDEVSELALSHVSRDATRAAYARDELLEQRRELMKKWASYCLSIKTSKANREIQ